jgi:hypothetical protein
MYCVCDAMQAGDDMMAAAVASCSRRRQNGVDDDGISALVNLRHAMRMRREMSVCRERWMSACRGRSDWRWSETMKLMAASVKRGRS